MRSKPACYKREWSHNDQGGYRRPPRGRRPPRLPRGFSLVEIMVVLVIIGLLAGVVTLNVRGYLVRAKQNTARMEIASICDALESYYSVFDRYPSNEDGLAALTKTGERMPEPLLQRMPADPWGNPYEYNQPGRAGPYEVICYGADGREGGEGSDADISNADLKERRSKAAP